MRPGIRVRLTNIMTVKGRDGKPRRYIRVKGQDLIPLPDLPPDHPDFLEAYMLAMKRMKKAPPVTGSLVKLCQDYLKSSGHRALSLSYQSVLERHIGHIMAKAPDAMCHHLEPKHIRLDLAELQPSVAQARLKAWRTLAKFGRDSFKGDPTAGVDRPQLPKSDGFPPWTEAEIEAFRTRWAIGTVARAIFELLHWSGARVSDAVLIGPGMVGRDGVLTFRQSKTGELAYVPWTCTPASFADPRDQAIMHDALKACAGHMTFLATRQGRTRSGKSISNDVSADAREAGVNKTAHGLRKTRAVKLIEGGASTHDAMAWTGHVTVDELEHYAKSYGRKKAVMG